MTAATSADDLPSEMVGGASGSDVLRSKEKARRSVRGLVFGAWGEASPAAEGLLQACATAGAQRPTNHMSKVRTPQVQSFFWLIDQYH